MNLSPRHIARVENTKSAVVKLKKYRRYFTQDSARHLKRLDKMYDKKSDSITKVMLTNEKLRLLREKNGIKEPVDTLALLQQYASLLPVDSTVDNVLLALVGVLHQQAIVSKFYIVWRI